jgi:hypothetical protein
MPVNSSLLYGEMAASWLAHLGIPLFVSIIFPYFAYGLSGTMKMLAFIGFCCALSFLLQAALLSVIQASSCSGIHNVRYIFTGTIVATVITGAFLLIPAFIEPMRLMISQLFMRHLTLLTPEMEEYERKIKAAANVLVASEDTPVVKQAGGGIKQNEYDAQVFQEFAIGASYWGAFAGAYGFGVGSLYAGSCK